MRLELEVGGALRALVDALESDYQHARRETNRAGAMRFLVVAAGPPEQYRRMREALASTMGTHGLSLRSKPQVLDTLAGMMELDQLRIARVGEEPVTLPPPGPPPVAAPVPVARKQEEKPLDWIGVELVDEDGNPLEGEPYEIELSDGRVEKGEFTDTGSVTVPAIPKGTCKVKFPRLDREVAKS